MKAFFDASDICLDQFVSLCSRSVSNADYPRAMGVESNVVLYDGDALREQIEEESAEQALLAELNRCLSSGPGVLVIKRMYPDLNTIDACTEVLKRIIQGEKEQGYGLGDHFGNNERVWNSFQKVCLEDPELFIAYYGNPLIALLSRAWLGPFYQITAQVNNVKPGSKAQSPHRDYHLGFQTVEDVSQFPAHVQVMSQYSTLQGAVAHTDMPLESGPTLLLPFSQNYPPGYMAYEMDEFVEYFNAHHVQLPLDKGDGLFFSPALFHGAGTNQGSSDRFANLLQISSAFGRPMESVDSHQMIQAIYPTLLRRQQEGKLKDRFVRDIISAVADGYSFPTNLDRDPPKGGYAPLPEGKLLHLALTDAWSPEQLQNALAAYRERRKG